MNKMDEKPQRDIVIYCDILNEFKSTHFKVRSLGIMFLLLNSEVEISNALNVTCNK